MRLPLALINQAKHFIPLIQPEGPLVTFSSPASGRVLSLAAAMVLQDLQETRRK